jgi:hypothetical protein
MLGVDPTCSGCRLVSGATTLSLQQALSFLTEKLLEIGILPASAVCVYQGPPTKHDPPKIRDCRNVFRDARERRSVLDEFFPTMSTYDYSN